jgi:electron transfer flavoprotein alpha subunit
MNGILVYSESQETALGLLTRAIELVAEQNTPVSIAFLGDFSPAQSDLFFAHGATNIYVGEDRALAHFDSRAYAEALDQIVGQSKADVILIGSTQQGRELTPRLAQKLSAGCLTDALSLSYRDSQLVVERRGLGGNTVSTKVITSPIQVIAVMPKIYEAGPGDASEGEVITVPLQLSPPSTRLLEHQPKEAGSVNIENADVLVCVGRGVANVDDLHLVESLADALRGMVACTRPISHENHWLAEDQMIGISGKVLSPRLYLGVGVSGQIQHTVGILDAKTIVAINKDSNAPIFNIADYGIVGDLYQVIPKLIEHIKGE